MEVSDAITECFVDNQYVNQTDLSESIKDFTANMSSRFAMLLYIVNPSDMTHQHVHDMPDYYNHVAPAVMILMLTEIILRGLHKSYDSYRSNDFFASTGSSILYMAVSGPTRTIEILLYQWAYERRLFTFDWQSPITWWVAAVGVDFLFYWFHRFAHETNIGWAGHQVHHGSEDYNLSASIRQSAILKLYTILFYIPLGYFGVPLAATLVHMQLNIIYQLWLHTELVSTLGPLEWIFNTPSHHRVHHGSEPWCLDKNYGGVLIIFDRMFGTFQPEIKDKKITYGLVDQPQSMNTLYLETFYYKHVFDKFMAQRTWIDRFKAIFYGPGWTPGSPRLGFPLPELPADQPRRKKYDPQLPRILELYLLVHFFIATFVQQAVMLRYKSLSGISVVCNTLYTITTMGVIGGMYDGWSGAMMLEVFRCTFYIVYFSFHTILNNILVDRFVLGYLTFSVLLWSFQSVNRSHHELRWFKKVV